MFYGNKGVTYEEIPEFTEEVEGTCTVLTTGDEMGVFYAHSRKQKNTLVKNRRMWEECYSPPPVRFFC